jgi:hypothetical protein
LKVCASLSIGSPHVYQTALGEHQRLDAEGIFVPNRRATQEKNTG